VYDFTFDNVANGAGTVDGTVTLPSSADGTYTATSILVTSNTGGTFPGLGLGQYVGNPTADSFVISGGNITNASKFFSLGPTIHHRTLFVVP
jgi:hypothetical protein